MVEKAFHMNFPLVSITITTKNEEANIGTCLKSIKAQSYGNIETIVVDNHSVDRTQDIARSFTDKVFDKGPERSAQRNFGMMQVAKGDYLMFIDADMILAPDLIGDCVERLNRQDAVALHIPEIVLGTNFWSRVRRFERSCYDGTVIDGVRFCRRDVFLRIAGFDESLTGVEDWDLDKKIKQVGSIALLDGQRRGDPGHPWELAAFIRERGGDPDGCRAAIFHNEADFRFVEYLRKKNYYANWLAAYARKWGCDDADIRKQLGFGYRYFGVFLENGKWKRLLGNPALSAGMYTLRFLVGLVYLFKKDAAEV